MIVSSQIIHDLGDPFDLNPPTVKAHSDLESHRSESLGLLQGIRHQNFL